MNNGRELVVKTPWLKVGCILGEGTHKVVPGQFPFTLTTALFTGPLYDSGTSTLHFVDISDKKVGCIIYNRKVIYIMTAFRSTTSTHEVRRYL